MWNLVESLSSFLSGMKQKTQDTVKMTVHKGSALFRKNQKVIICIEGNISSGKSTTVNELKEMFKDNKRVCFLLEPLSIWESIRDDEGNNMITKFYGDIKKYAFAFQMMAYISRLNILRQALRNDEVEIIITERSLFTDKNVFAKMLFDDGLLEDVEHQIYMKWFDSFIDDLPDAKMFYIRTDPQVALDRLHKRNREGENVSLEYLTRVHQYHDTWLMNKKDVVMFDGNVDITSTQRPSQNIAIMIHNMLLTKYTGPDTPTSPSSDYDSDYDGETAV